MTMGEIELGAQAVYLSLPIEHGSGRDLTWSEVCAFRPEHRRKCEAIAQAVLEAIQRAPEASTAAIIKDAVEMAGHLRDFAKWDPSAECLPSEHIAWDGAVTIEQLVRRVEGGR